jgi:AcrR family transcriptional regulator
MSNLLAVEDVADEPRSRVRNARGQGARLRIELLEAAIRMLDDGRVPAELSLRAVAAAAGVSPTAVYRHFPDHAALLLAIRDHCLDLLEGYLEVEDPGAVRELFADPVGSVRRRARGFLRFAIERPTAYRALVEISADHAVDPTRMQVLAQWVTIVAVRLVEETRSSADPVDVAALIMAFTHGASHLHATLPVLGWPDPDRRIDLFVDALVLHLSTS